MFEVVVLHEAMPITAQMNGTSESRRMEEQWSIHLSFEDVQISASTMANPCPHVNFHRVLGLGFVRRFLSFLITARPPVCFNLHCCFIHQSVHTETGSELVGPNRFTKIGFDDLLAFTLLIQNRFKLHMFVHMLSTTETMEPFLVVCALLWAKMMLLHHFRVCPSCRHLFGISC